MGEIPGYNPEAEMARKRAEKREDAQQASSGSGTTRRGFLAGALVAIGAAAIPREAKAIEYVANAAPAPDDNETKVETVETSAKKIIERLFRVGHEIESHYDVSPELYTPEEMDEARAHFVANWNNVAKIDKEILFSYLAGEANQIFGGGSGGKSESMARKRQGAELTTLCNLFSKFDAYGALYASIPEGSIKEAVDSFLHDDRKYAMRAADYLPKSGEIKHEDLDLRLKKEMDDHLRESLEDSPVFAEGSFERTFFDLMLDDEGIRKQFRDSNCSLAEVLSIIKATVYEALGLRASASDYVRKGDEIVGKGMDAVALQVDAGHEVTQTQENESGWFEEILENLETKLGELGLHASLARAVGDGTAAKLVSFFLKERSRTMNRAVFSPEVEFVLIASIDNESFEGDELYVMAKKLCPNSRIKYLVDRKLAQGEGRAVGVAAENTKKKAPRARTKDTFTRKNLLEAIPKTHGKTTIYLNTHGTLTSIDTGEGDTDSVNFSLLADSLVRRGKELENITLVVDACISRDFTHLLYQELQARRVDSLPYVVTSANFMDESTDAVLNDAILRFGKRQDNKPVTFGTVARRIQPHTYGKGDITFFAGQGKEYTEIARSIMESEQQSGALRAAA